MERKPLRFGRIDGGQFDSLDASAVPQNGWKRVVNLLPYNERLNLRDGQQRVSFGDPTVAGATALLPVTGINNIPAGYTDYAILVGTSIGEWAYVDQNGVWDGPVTRLFTGDITDDEMPWILRQRQGVVYAARRNFGLGRVEGNVWARAGRTAPTQALTCSTADTSTTAWRFAYTYLDSLTGNESNPSPYLSKLTGLTGTIPLANFVQADSSVIWDKYRLYATKANGGVLFPIADLASSTTSYTFDMAAAIAGTLTYGARSLSTRNGTPDVTTTCFEIWNERGWISDGEKLKYSDIALVEGYSEIQNLPFNPSDNDTIQVIYGWGDYLVVAKRRSMVLLSGYDRSSFEQKLWTDKAGCIAPHSMKDCEGTLVWLGDSGFMSATPGAPPRNISSKQIAEALKQLDPDRSDLVVADVIADKQLYVVSFPRLDGTWGGVAYNWRTSAWTEYDFPSDPTFLVSGFDEKLLPKTLAITNADDSVYAIFEGVDDSGQPIAWSALTGSPDTGGIRLSGLASVSLLTVGSRYAITASAYRNGGELVHSRTVRLLGEPGWKQISLSTMKRLGSQLQVGLAGAARGPFWIGDVEWDYLATQFTRSSF